MYDCILCMQTTILLKKMQPNLTKGVFTILRTYEVEMDEMVVMESLDLEGYRAGMERME